MSQNGKVHLLTRVYGRKEVHLVGNADLSPSFKVLKQQIGDLWGIEDVSSCVLENAGPLLESPDEAIIIGSEEEWDFARDRLCRLADARPSTSTALTTRNSTEAYDPITGYCNRCHFTRSRNMRSCNGCGSAAPPVEAAPIEPIPMLVRSRPSRIT